MFFHTTWRVFRIVNVDITTYGTTFYDIYVFITMPPGCPASRQNFGEYNITEVISVLLFMVVQFRKY